ncbi:MAG: YedE family putative selenium transporter [Bacillota bacterium]
MSTLGRHRAIAAAGFAIGALAALLQRWGNPANLGLCIACFIRDSSGALGLHRAAAVQYLRPELPGIIIGAWLAALWAGEFRPRGTSSAAFKFALGVLMVFGALVFLGCPLRAALRLAGGDLSALAGLAGLLAGGYAGGLLVRGGYSTGKAQPAARFPAFLFIVGALALVALGAVRPVADLAAGGPIFASSTGPGSLRAAWPLSLAAGLMVGIAAQRTRLCLIGAVRNPLFSKDFHLTAGLGGILVGAAGLNLAFGQFRLAAAGPIAHSHIPGNFLGLALVGLAATLAGGCPLRQLVLAAEGNQDGVATVLGMGVGAALAHNFRLASTTAGPAPLALPLVAVSLALLCLGGLSMRERPA